MELKVGRRRTTVTGHPSPKAANVGSNIASSPANVPAGGGVPSSDAGGNQNPNSDANREGRSKSRVYPISRNNSLLRLPTPATKTTGGLSSGTHIRRRPPSIQGRPASPLQRRSSLRKIKKEVIERRSDPSPAPSRPPRKLRKHSNATSPPMPSLNTVQAARGALDNQRITSVFHHGNDRMKPAGLNRIPLPMKRNSIQETTGTASQGSPASGSFGVVRRNIVLDVKQNPRQVADRKQLLEALPPTNRMVCEDAVQNYRELCVTLGQTPEDAWINAVLEDASKAKALSSSKCGPDSPTETRIAAKERDRSASLSQGFREHGQGKRTVSNNRLDRRLLAAGEDRKGSSSGFTNVHNLSSVTREAGGVLDMEKLKECVNKESALHRMLSYCQKLQPYQQKIKLLKNGRRDVDEALRRFLSVCRVHSISVEKSSKQSSMAAMESHANSLTDALQELQRCNVNLLLHLTECFCEVRMPLGSVSSELETDVARQQQQRQQPYLESIQSDSKRSENRHSIFNSPNSGKRDSLSPLDRMKDPTQLTTPVNSSSTKEPLQAFLSYLHEEERRIVRQLNDVCARVREALTSGQIVTIADDAMLDTPLFLSSSVINNTPSSNKVEQQPQHTQKRIGQSILPGSPKGHGVTTLTITNASSPASLRNSAAVGTGGAKSVAKKNKTTVATENSSHTALSDRAHSEDPANGGPFVGVAMSAWTHAEDDASSVGGASSNNNTNNSRRFVRCNTGSPQLVLGGGKRCHSFQNRPKATSGANRPVGRSKSMSASSPTQRRKTIASAPTASKPPLPTATKRPPMRSNNNRARSKSSTGSDSADTILAANIKKAEATWKAIKGLANLGSTQKPSQVQMRNVEPTRKRENKNDFPQKLVAGEEPFSEANLLTPTPRNLEQKDIARRPQGFSLKSNLDPTALQSPSSLLWSPDASGDRGRDKMTITTDGSTPLRYKMPFKEEQAEKLRHSVGSPNVRRPLDGTIVFRENHKQNAAMATRIQCCWRQYVARRKTQERRKQVNEENRKQQRWHIENVMAFRLQRLFARNVARRWRQRELARAQSEASVETQSHTKMTDNKGSEGNKENCERQQSLRERFEQARERRRNLLSSTSNGKGSASDLTSDSFIHSETTARKEQPQPMSGRAVSVPPLDLKSSGISAFAIENYQPEKENFNVSVLHRLLHAPKSLLYVARVLCDAAPTEPASAFAFLESVEPTPSKRKSRTSESLHTARGESEAEAKKEEKDNKQTTSQHGEDSEMRAKNTNGTGENSLHCHPRRDIKNESEMLWNVQSYRNMCRRLLNRKPTTMKNIDDILVCPFSVHVKSFVEQDEMRHKVPITKGFQRPFERWGTAHAFQARVFSAAAVYAWKLIFSHTPHDDYKQRQLKTKEEQEARLRRVEQRNSMILACYCVRSEREWLKEASKDLGFVGRIWNPKRSLDPNDPDFERHCRETYHFVEDFLYQCFQTVNHLEEVPVFLAGAGIYFLLRDTLASIQWKEEGSQDTESDIDFEAAYAIDGKQLTASTADINLVNSQLPLTAQQRKMIFTYEMLKFLEDFIACSTSMQSRRAETVTDSEINDSIDDVEDNERNTVNCNTNKKDELSNKLQKACEQVAQSSIGEPTPLGDSVTASFTSSRSEFGAAMPLMQRPRLRILSAPRPELSANDLLEKGSIDAKSLNRKNSAVEFEIVCPTGYLVSFSERLLHALLEMKVDLEICEGLDATY